MKYDEIDERLKRLHSYHTPPSTFSKSLRGLKKQKISSSREIQTDMIHPGVKVGTYMSYPFESDV